MGIFSLAGRLLEPCKFYSVQFCYYYPNFCRKQTLKHLPKLPLSLFFHFGKLAKGLKLIILYLPIYQIDEQHLRVQLSNRFHDYLSLIKKRESNESWAN